MSILKRVLAELEKAEIIIVYLVSYDLTNASGEYARITRAFDDAGYTRDSNYGEDTLPRNFYAAQKTIKYDGSVEKPEDVIKRESTKFHALIKGIIEEHAQGKLTRLFTSVSEKDRTAIAITSNS